MKLIESKIEITILGKKGRTAKQEMPCYRIPGMLRAPIVVAGIPNKGGTTSYSITHTLTGAAIIPGMTECIDDVARAAKKIWQQLGPEERQLLNDPKISQRTNEPAYQKLGYVVEAAKRSLKTTTRNKIRAEVKRQLAEKAEGKIRWQPGNEKAKEAHERQQAKKQAEDDERVEITARNHYAPHETRKLLIDPRDMPRLSEQCTGPCECSPIEPDSHCPNGWPSHEEALISSVG